MCDSGVSHSVSLVEYVDGGRGWVQVGWRFYAWWQAPRAYCEVTPAPGGGMYLIRDYGIVPGLHDYKWTLDRDTGFWRCRVDGVVKLSVPSGHVGFESACCLNVQGEAHSSDVQIGRMYPNKLPFTSMSFRKLGSPDWRAFTALDLNAPPAIYGRDVPSDGAFRVWTYAH